MMCTGMWDPQCGCDGEQYSNPCQATCVSPTPNLGSGDCTPAPEPGTPGGGGNYGGNYGGNDGSDGSSGETAGCLSFSTIGEQQIVESSAAYDRLADTNFDECQAACFLGVRNCRDVCRGPARTQQETACDMIGWASMDNECVLYSEAQLSPGQDGCGTCVVEDGVHNCCNSSEQDMLEFFQAIEPYYPVSGLPMDIDGSATIDSHDLLALLSTSELHISDLMKLLSLLNDPMNPCPASDADDCASSPCLNGGACTDSGEWFQCACGLGFEGQTCDQVAAAYQAPITGGRPFILAEKSLCASTRVGTSDWISLDL